VVLGQACHLDGCRADHILGACGHFRRRTRVLHGQYPELSEWFRRRNMSRWELEIYVWQCVMVSHCVRIVWELEKRCRWRQAMTRWDDDEGGGVGLITAFDTRIGMRESEKHGGMFLRRFREEYGVQWSSCWRGDGQCCVCPFGGTCV